MSGTGIHYPATGLYRNNEDCRWTITRNAPITLHFVEFAIEGPSTCVYDYLKVEADGVQLWKRCGSTLPNDYYTGKKSIVLTFHSDGSTVYGGFKVKVTATGMNLLKGLSRFTLFLIVFSYLSVFPVLLCG